MSFLVSLLPVAGCGLMMWFCMRGMRRGKCSAETAPRGEVDELRAQCRRSTNSTKAIGARSSVPQRLPTSG